MSKLPMSLSLIDNTLGISCVEKHMVAIMRYCNIQYQAVFLESFVKINDTIEEFYNNKIQYAYYNGLNRIQNTSKSLLISELIDIREEFKDMIKLSQNSISNNLPVLIAVDPIKLPQGNAVPWRRDHYVCVYGIKSNSLLIIDDMPQRTMEISVEEIKQAYQGNMLIFNKLKGFNKDEYLVRCNKQILQIIELSTVKSIEIDSLIPKDLDSLILFRDALGIIKVSRQRLSEWMNLIDGESGINNYKSMIILIDHTVKLLNKLYCTIEVYRLRKKVNIDVVRNELENIFEAEKSWVASLKQLANA